MQKLTPTLVAGLLGAATLQLAACEEKKKADVVPKAAPVTAPSPAPAASVAAADGAVPAPPKGLIKLPVPADNPITPAKVDLGHKLFFDKRLSVDGSRACYSCHQNEDGTGGHEPLAIGAKDKKLTRHAPVMWNVAYLPRFYWDGRANSLEAQAKGAWGGGNMGVGKENLDKKAEEISKIEGYKALFEKAFPGEKVTADLVAKAIASYERTLFCGDTAWDKFQAGDKSAMTDDQKKGWELFTGKAACNSCHTPPMFSDAYTSAEGTYHNAGIGIEGVKEADVDVGRKAVSKNDSDWASFKTPTLRNITKTAPYFHDGHSSDLTEAVTYMAKGAFKNKNLDPKFKDRELTEDEIKQLVAFMKALECGGKLEEPELPK